VSRIEQQSAEQSRRIAELEARLVLLERESQQWREQVPEKPAETIRIGARRRDGESEGEVASRPIQVVRLHEPDPEPLDEAWLPLPQPPAGVSTRIPVVALPEQRAATLVALPAASGISAREAYRAALGLVKERRWEDSVKALSAFLVDHPGDALTANALYWRAEAYYGQRRYDDALAEFRALLSRFPKTDKTADCLLKVGLCHLRLGDQAKAKGYFEQVRAQYPDSDAARTASREGAS
jgi:tol-pal system protein YbgF